jgi:hypothetical protein
LFLNQVLKKYEGDRYEQVYWARKNGDRTRPIANSNDHRKAPDSSF